MAGNFDIEEIAKLASIKLNKKELEKLSTDLAVILEHVEALSSLDLSDLDTTIHPLGVHLQLREDVIEDGLTHEESIHNAPEEKDGYFKVPPSLE